MCTFNGHVGCLFSLRYSSFFQIYFCHSLHILHDGDVIYISICYFIAYQAKSDTYEKLVKEMVMDQRARPSDRTKTPEEIAQEEKERLEKLEVCSI
jgi:hypothetical protein